MKGILFGKNMVNLAAHTHHVGGSWRLRGKNVVAYNRRLVRFFYTQIARAKNPVVLDIGASTGSFTLLGTVHPTLWVTAFEPNPEARLILARNVALNGLQKRVKILPYALMNYDGKGRLKVPAQSGLATLAKTPSRFREWRTVKVQVRKLDSLDVGPVHAIKIDVEGAELSVLHGAEKYIRKHHPAILIEFKALNTRQFGYEPEEITKLLTAWGYKQFKKVGNEDLWARK